MKKIIWNLILFGLFILAVSVYYNIPLAQEIDKIFVTLATFLFSIFIGFFISRQSSRYAEIRKLIADFDGVISAIYRSFEHFGGDLQKKAGAIIVQHYTKVVSHGWDFPFTHKTTTISDLHRLHEEAVNEKGNGGVLGAVVTRNMLGLQELQKIRKNMVSLREERIPSFQWLLITIIGVVLIVTMSTISSVGIMLVSLIKAAFLVAVLVALSLLHQLDSLHLFSGKIGAHSAQDVLDIIEKKK